MFRYFVIGFAGFALGFGVAGNVLVEGEQPLRMERPYFSSHSHPTNQYVVQFASEASNAVHTDSLAELQQGIMRCAEIHARAREDDAGPDALAVIQRDVGRLLMWHRYVRHSQ